MCKKRNRKLPYEEINNHERIYSILKPYIEEITTSCLDIQVSAPWAKELKEN